jgi:protein-S-isoprenylcysteine O-methyltransferase Ste14
MPLFHNDIWRQQIGATLLYWGLLPSLVLRSTTALMVSYPLFLIWSLLLLRKEERILALRFKEEYRRYQHEVPFLLPRLRRSKP